MSVTAVRGNFKIAAASSWLRPTYLRASRNLSPSNRRGASSSAVVGVAALWRFMRFLLFASTILSLYEASDGGGLCRSRRNHLRERRFGEHQSRPVLRSCRGFRRRRESRFETER